MTISIVNKEPNSGRIQAEDNSTVNIADLMKPKAHIFHDGSLAPGNGASYNNVDDREEFTFSIGGTSTAQAYEFRTIDHAGNDALVNCYRHSDSEEATGTNVKGETWHAPIKGMPYFYVKATTLSGGTGIAKGWASAK